jgi:hypothetical protein
MADHSMAVGLWIAGSCSQRGTILCKCKHRQHVMVMVTMSGIHLNRYYTIRPPGMSGPRGVTGEGFLAESARSSILARHDIV